MDFDRFGRVVVPPRAPVSPSSVALRPVAGLGRLGRLGRLGLLEELLPDIFKAATGGTSSQDTATLAQLLAKQDADRATQRSTLAIFAVLGGLGLAGTLAWYAVRK